jgi:hypothetical protein
MRRRGRHNAWKQPQDNAPPSSHASNGDEELPEQVLGHASLMREANDRCTGEATEGCPNPFKENAVATCGRDWLTPNSIPPIGPNQIGQQAIPAT